MRMEQLLLYGLDHASHDFRTPSSLGKNIFTNAFPISLCQYLDIKRDLPIPTIQAVLGNDGRLTTEHKMVSWNEIINTSSDKACFEFEGIFNSYEKYTHGTVNKSDVVVVDRISKEHKRPLEIKLVVVPTSSTADQDREHQSCEIVVRPPTVEQLAFSIANSYGEKNRREIQNIIVDALGKPSDYQWNEEKSMIGLMPRILVAAEKLAKGGLKLQTPLVLNAIWRTEGQKPILEEHAFDVFVWTDMAFIQLFTDQVRREYLTDAGSEKKYSPKNISRPARTLVWLVKSLLDYAIQETLDFSKIQSRITYGSQSDKAGAFSGFAPLKHLNSKEFQEPRIGRSELSSILSPLAAQYLLPERRLDAAIAIQHLAEELSREPDLH